MAPVPLADQGATCQQTVPSPKKLVFAVGLMKVGPTPARPLIGMASGPLAPNATLVAEVVTMPLMGNCGVPAILVEVHVCGVAEPTTAAVETMASVRKSM